jgi:hypothetical protein
MLCLELLTVLVSSLCQHFSNANAEVEEFYRAVITRKIVRGIISKWKGVVGTGWSRLRVGTGGGNLRIR